MRHALFLVALAALVPLAVPNAAAAGGTLRVCAEPDNLPYSDKAKSGFENKLASMLAQDLGETVAYTWARGGEGFLDHTLLAGKCDVVMEAPEGLPEVATTRPYYESAYVFVYRKDRGLDLTSLRDPRLRHLKIAVHLLGDGSTPPAEALAREGIVENVSGYMLHGDRALADPPAQILQAVERGDVDVAAVWGPLAGYFAKSSPVALRVVPITGTSGFAPLVFRFPIAVGVRKGDVALRDALDRAIAAHRDKIRNLLTGYGIPLEPLSGG